MGRSVPNSTEKATPKGASRLSSRAAEDSGQVSLGDLAGAAVLDELRKAAVDTLTPIEALNLLYRLKQKL